MPGPICYMAVHWPLYCALSSSTPASYHNAFTYRARLFRLAFYSGHFPTDPSPDDVATNKHRAACNGVLAA